MNQLFAFTSCKKNNSKFVVFLQSPCACRKGTKKRGWVTAMVQMHETSVDLDIRDTTIEENLFNIQYCSVVFDYHQNPIVLKRCKSLQIHTGCISLSLSLSLDREQGFQRLVFKGNRMWLSGSLWPVNLWPVDGRLPWFYLRTAVIDQRSKDLLQDSPTHTHSHVHTNINTYKHTPTKQSPKPNVNWTLIVSHS